MPMSNNPPFRRSKKATPASTSIHSPNRTMKTSAMMLAGSPPPKLRTKSCKQSWFGKFQIAFTAAVICFSSLLLLNYDTSIDRSTVESMEGLHLGELLDYSDTWTVGNMWKALNCNEIFEGERPVHSQTVWDNSRALYKGIVGKDSSITDNARNGFQVPVEVKQAPPKGRGIFASKDVRAGELMWSTKKTARFKDGPSYRKFIFGLEDGVACDVLQWAYVQDMGDGDLRVSVDLDEGCFCNGESSDTGGNMGCDEEAARNFEGGCIDNYFALKDIKAGEEVVCLYGQFVVPGGWKEFGL